MRTFLYVIKGGPHAGRRAGPSAPGVRAAPGRSRRGQPAVASA